LLYIVEMPPVMISISTLKIVEGSATLLRSARNYTSLIFLEIKMISDSMLLNDDWLPNLALLEHSHGFEKSAVPVISDVRQPIFSSELAPFSILINLHLYLRSAIPDST